MNAPALSLAEAARTTGASVSTIRRRLNTGGIEGAHRTEDGSWRIPIAGLIAAGLAPKTTPATASTGATSSTPKPEALPPADTAEVDRLRAELEAAHRRELENARAEVDRLRADNGRLLETIERLSRALPPATATDETSSTPLTSSASPAPVDTPPPSSDTERYTKYATFRRMLRKRRP